MAQVPSEDETKEAQAESVMDIELKRVDQEAQGKTFEIDEHGHAPGVIPESSWKRYKDE